MYNIQLYSTYLALHARVGEIILGSLFIKIRSFKQSLQPIWGILLFGEHTQFKGLTYVVSIYWTQTRALIFNINDEP